MAYVYRHIRTDINQPFYIGACIKDDPKYIRAYEKAIGRRRKEWYEITKNSSYEVEILLDNLSEEEAYKKETEFIKLHGRIDLGTGSLINKTDGGKGIVNGITKETREKMASKLRGRPLPEWQKEILSKAKKGKSCPWFHVPIYQFDLKGNFIKEYKCIAEAANDLNLYSGNICQVLDDKRPHAGGFVFERKGDDFEKICEKVKNRTKRNIHLREIKIVNVNNGKVFNSIKEAARAENIPYTTLKAAFYKKGMYKYLIKEK